MIFLHGGGVSGWMWDKQVDFFKDKYYVLIPDLPSHGKSGGEEFLSINKAAKDIIGIIQERRNGQEITMIGFSLGAQIALEILSMKEEMIDRAIIVSGLVIPMNYFKSIINPITRVMMPLTKNKSFAKLQAKVLYVREEYFDLYFSDTKQMSVDALIKILEENMSYQLSDQFVHSHAKILVLVGDKEKTMMKKSAIFITKSNNNCRGYILPKVGHGVSLASPDLFNKIVEAWINDKELPMEMKSIE
ncbi:alpha/beta fold hydrolase [Paenibacillus sp. IHBB 10380]|uniref:alpha/beta fold hydrolase n=1 Tax=Paenibacillus sp. IHBB 10380 TaxID=1566358 RepID=UPI001F3BE0C1|nr:alpha/beta hydrolase [Paenibacillus sp. IHBB 10380]